MSEVELTAFVGSLAASPLAPWADRAPWQLTGESPAIVRELLTGLTGSGWQVAGDVAVHVTATVEDGAVLRPSAVVRRASLGDQEAT